MSCVNTNGILSLHFMSGLLRKTVKMLSVTANYITELHAANMLRYVIF